MNLLDYIDEEDDLYFPPYTAVSQFKETNDEFRSYMKRTDRRHKDGPKWKTKINNSLCCYNRSMHGGTSTWFNGGDSFDDVVSIFK